MNARESEYRSQVDDSDRQRFSITDQECEDVSWISISYAWKIDGHEKMSTVVPGFHRVEFFQ